MNKFLWALPILLISCGMSEEEIRAQREAQYKRDIAAVQQRCVSFGYKENDQFFPFCVQTQYEALLDARRAEYQQRAAAYQAISNTGRAMQDYANSNQSSINTGRINTVNSIGGTRLLCSKSPNPNELYCR